jgi:uncharacterized RDD family membrane protein YckC
MNCPTCGLLNVPTAQVCIHCRSPLEEPVPPAIPTKNVVSLRKAKILSSALNSFGAQNPPSQENENWRDQLNLKLEEIKIKTMEIEKNGAVELVETLRNREFVRPGLERPEEIPHSTFGTNSVGMHPLAEKTFQKLDQGQRTMVTLPSKDLTASAPELESGAPTASPMNTIPRPHTLKSDRIERIEIDLNQGTLPFDSFEENHITSPEELIRNGIAAAGVSERIRAGAIDGLFVTGCFLFFLLIILFIPEFKLLTKPSLLALIAVWVIFFVAYHYLFTALGGRTLGMEYEHLQVVNFEGQPISVEESRLRTLGYLISLGCFGLGYLWAMFDPDRLTWHDKISKTLIVEKETHALVSPEVSFLKGSGLPSIR